MTEIKTLKHTASVAITCSDKNRSFYGLCVRFLGSLARRRLGSGGGGGGGGVAAGVPAPRRGGLDRDGPDQLRKQLQLLPALSLQLCTDTETRAGGLLNTLASPRPLFNNGAHLRAQW